MYTYKEVGAMGAHIFNNSRFFFITITAGISPVNDYENIKNAFLLIADYCRKNNGIILHERIFAASDLYNIVKEARKAAYGNEKQISYTYIHSQTLIENCLAGISLQGMYCSENCIENIYSGGKAVGVKNVDRDMEVLVLHDLHSENNRLCPYEQTQEMFLKANILLNNNNFKFTDICRTWIYMDNILSQYDEFNKARNEIFHKLSFLQENNQEYEKIYIPASTGINGGNTYKSSGIMDVLAVKSKTKNINIYSDNGTLQNSAYRYGSAFSRSLIIEDQSRKDKIIYLSGTASIDKTGKTAFVNDIDKQITMTLNVIDALLQKHKTTRKNICEGTVFLKKKKFLENFLDVFEGKNIKEFPLIIVVADVCRDDLLFEMDATFLEKNE